MTNRASTTGAIFALLATLLIASTVPCAVASAGDPILAFNQTFVLYSDAYSSYCIVTGAPARLSCNVGVLEPSSGTPMILANGTGNVPSAPTTNLQIVALTPCAPGGAGYCVAPVGGSVHTFICNSTVPITSQSSFAVVNVKPFADGYLHVGASAVAILSHNTGFCTAAPMTSNGGYVNCGASSVGNLEMFHIVPL